VHRFCGRPAEQDNNRPWWRYDPRIDQLRPRDLLVRLILPLYLPAFLISIGVGMLIPVLPLYLRDIGLSYTLVTTVISGFAAGALVAQIPFGRAIARWRDRTVMLVSLLLLGISTWLLGVVAVTVWLIALRFAAGVGSTGWFLSRHAFMTTDIPVDVRGRVTSTFGGTNRAAVLVGPVIGGFAAEHWGYAAAFALAGVLSAVGLIPLLALQGKFAVSPPRTAAAAGSFRSMLRTKRAHLVSAGTVQLGVLAAREGRHAVIPLLGAAIGLDIAEVGILVAVSSAADLALFPVSGFLMDRYGRAAALVPSLSMLGIGLFLAGAARGPVTLGAAVVVVGIGNGMGAGTMLAIGSDLAPPADPSPFLSVLATIRDIGRVGGPLLVGAMADSVGLSWSAVALGCIAIATAVFMATVLGDTRRAVPA
jgi:MFS family permease